MAVSSASGRREGLAAYLSNGFWLLLPVLLLDLLFTGQLPPEFQLATFWRDIPPWIGIPENTLRTASLALPLFLHVSLRTPAARLGAGIYLAGLAAYGFAWFMLIAYPDSAWSRGALGIMAPAYTPLLWLIGLALLADRIFFFPGRYRPWMFIGISVAFLIFHNFHTALVVLRQS